MPIFVHIYDIFTKYIRMICICWGALQYSQRFIIARMLLSLFFFLFVLLKTLDKQHRLNIIYFLYACYYEFPIVFVIQCPHARRNIIGEEEKHNIYLPNDREHVVEKEYTKPLQNNVIFIFVLNNSRFSPRVYSIVRAVRPKNRFKILSFPGGL